MPTPTPTELATRLATQLAKDLALEATAFKHLSDADRKAVEYRVQTFIKLMGDARGDDHDTFMIALSNFAARFLPPLVAACEWFGGGGCYGAVLLLVVQTPYFAKYIRANGAWFYANYVEQLIQVNVESGDSPPTAVLQWLQILSHLLMYSLMFRRVRKISKRTQHKVERWMLCTNNHSRRAVQAQRTLYLAGPDIDKDIVYLTDLIMEANKLGRTGETAPGPKMKICRTQTLHDYVPWAHCGVFDQHCHAAGCGLHSPMMLKDQRGMCGRCQATTYCGKEHQRLDWANHRLRCFKTVY